MIERYTMSVKGGERGAWAKPPAAVRKRRRRMGDWRKGTIASFVEFLLDLL